MGSKYVSLTDKEREGILALQIPTTLRKKIEGLDKKKSPRYGKNKGASFQKWVCQQIADLLEIEFDNKNDQCEIHAREMGNSGNDIILRGRAYQRFPFDIECKNSENISIQATMEQAQSNTKEGRFWMIAWKRKSFKKPIVIMDWSVFAMLWKGYDK
jgi:hypothetical protein